MVKVAVCIETFFTELSCEKRAERVAAIGYPAVEFWLHDHYFDGENLIPRKKNLETMTKIMKDFGLEYWPCKEAETSLQETKALLGV